MAKVGEQSIKLDNVYLKECAVTVGPKEGEGPLRPYFDFIYDNLRINNENSWEKSEMRMFDDAINIVLTKNQISENDIDMIVSGDLNNQIVISNYVLRNHSIPYIGVFGACTTLVEAVIVASQFLENNNFKNVLVGTSSHNATAERQFRYPTEYGGKKVETSTMTVTAAGVGLLTSQKTKIKISRVTIGKVYDNEMKDSLDMGRIMSIGAFYTIKQHFKDFNVKPDEYDLILTGDLSYYGKDMLIKIFSEYDIDITKNYNDCGLMIYDRNEQDVLSGGSGCGCCAAVTLGYIVHAIKKGIYNKVLIVATGALLNPIMVAQKETIPSIAHAMVLEGV